MLVFLAWAVLAPGAHAAPARAGVDAAGWLLLPEVPELRQTFPAGRLQAHVPNLARCVAQSGSGKGIEITCNPSAITMRCWSEYVSDSSERHFARQKPREYGDDREAFCVSDWLVDEDPDLELGVDRCPYGQKGRACIRAGTKLPTFWASLFPWAKESIDPKLLPLLDKDFKTIHAMAEELAQEYTAFDYLRRGHSQNRFNTQLSQLTIGQGLAVLYQARVMLRMKEDLQESGCGSKHLDSYFDLASEASRFAMTSLRGVMDTYPSKTEKWQRQLYELQIAVLDDRATLENKLSFGNFCEEAWATGAEMDGYDADVYAWCAYGYLRINNIQRAKQAMGRAVRSTNHPEMSSYASWAIRTLLGD